MPQHTVGEDWTRIRAWLTTHAPDAADHIRPPAAASAIADAEREIGLPLPPDLREWWAVAEGMSMHGVHSVLPTSYTPVSIEQCLRGRQIWLGIDRTERARGYDPDVNPTEAGTTPVRFSPAFLPIAQDGGGSSLFVDLRDGRHRGVVEWTLGSGFTWSPVWSGVAEMPADVAGACADGIPALDVHARAQQALGHPAWRYLPGADEDGRLTWRPAPPRADGANGGAAPSPPPRACRRSAAPTRRSPRR